MENKDQIPSVEEQLAVLSGDAPESIKVDSLNEPVPKITAPLKRLSGNVELNDLASRGKIKPST